MIFVRCFSSGDIRQVLFVRGYSSGVLFVRGYSSGVICQVIFGR